MAGTNAVAKATLKDNGKLADIAPTILNVMGLDVPQEISGDKLLYRV